MGDQPCRKASAYIGLQKQEKKHREISMPQVGLEFMIPVSERSKASHALDNAATEIGPYFI
jgi:hypothetical protein